MFDKLTIFLVDKQMRFVNDNDNFSVRSVFEIVVAVPDDLVFEIFQDQEHLRVGDHSVFVGEQFLKIETYKVFVRFKAGRAVPQIRISAARFELCDIVLNDFQTGAVVIVLCRLQRQVLSLRAL